MKPVSWFAKCSERFAYAGRALAGGVTTAVFAGLVFAQFWNNSSAASVTPILVSDFCTGEVPTQVSDRAFGLNRVISNALREDSTNRIIRAPSERTLHHKPETQPNSIILDGALIQSKSGLMLTIEFINMETRAVLWSGAYDLSKTSPERIARMVSHELMTVKNST